MPAIRSVRRACLTLITVCGLTLPAAGQIVHLPAPPPQNELEQDTLPSPEALIARHLEVTGGREAHARLHNRKMEGTLVQNGQSMAITIHQSAPNNQYALVGGPGGMRFVTNAEESWTFEGDNIVASSGDQRLQEIRRAAWNALLDWPKHYPLAKTLGAAEVDGRPAWEVRLITEECDEQRLFFDQETGLHVRSVQDILYAGEPLHTVATLTDYREFDGIQLPTRSHRVLTYTGGRLVQDFEYTSIEHNIDMPEALFETPPELAPAG